jgi:hypothetical protein
MNPGAALREPHAVGNKLNFGFGINNLSESIVNDLNFWGHLTDL